MAVGMNDRCRRCGRRSQGRCGRLANHRSIPIDFIKRSAAQPHETTPIVFSLHFCLLEGRCNQDIWQHNRLPVRRQPDSIIWCLGIAVGCPHPPIWPTTQRQSWGWCGCNRSSSPRLCISVLQISLRCDLLSCHSKPDSRATRCLEALCGRQFVNRLASFPLRHARLQRTIAAHQSARVISVQS